MKTLIDADSLQVRISEMALEIDSYYQKQDWYHNTQEQIVIIGVLNGAVFFMADLVRQLSIRMKLDFVKISTYPNKSTVAKKPKVLLWPKINLYNKEGIGNVHVLLIDDILDTGKTLGFIEDHMLYECPLSMKTAVLLRKPGKAKNLETVKFVGFNIEDKWVAGYGMDDSHGQRREVQCVFIDDN